ncbi:HD domain-containing phosphohydrolase [Marinomonas algarum]|uniref:Response regulator n=1 Tax=Marinomonas algarum TaxID=2883105 RepID=A0A9X1LBC7_9GAMM|nr:HD domain-containing phosphohydrolase [Marinomonas algarum]MCB5160694.1 response regulator [Marinomonas algarum]
MDKNIQPSIDKQSVLIVDDTPENIDVLKGILGKEYQIRAATNGLTALKIAESKQPDIILLDIMMPEMDGYEVCRRLKANPNTVKIPVIFVTAMAEAEDEEFGLNLGVVDYITKPINASITRARVKNHLAMQDQRLACEKEVRSRTQELEESNRAAIFMLGDAGHYNDTDTGAHIWRMAAYSGALARKLNWHVDDVKMLELAAPMHDTGKIGIADSILKAPRKLTSEEWEVMKTHSMIGYQILSQSHSPVFQLAAEIALSHHERWDGTGYPNGALAEAIPESARIVAIADVFDALTMKRPYKEEWSVDRALETIAKDAGSHFDPRLVEAFLSIKEEIIDIKKNWDTDSQDHAVDL